MKSVLISIQPKWVELIVSGKKTIEVRKTKPKLETPFKCYIYATKPKKWFRFSSWGYASDENLWLSNGKIKMCDGFEFWAGDKEYEPLCCKVIGEFVCDRIEDFSQWEFDYPSLLVHINLYAGTNGDYKFLDNYLKGEKYGYGWHISDLVIYDKPKELSEFKQENKCYKKGDLDNIGCWERGCIMQEQGWCDGRYSKITRPPQSWCYVESLGE